MSTSSFFKLDIGGNTTNLAEKDEIPALLKHMPAPSGQGLILLQVL